MEHTNSAALVGVKLEPAGTMHSHCFMAAKVLWRSFAGILGMIDQLVCEVQSMAELEINCNVVIWSKKLT